jgi:HEAT repeat protein
MRQIFLGILILLLIPGSAGHLLAAAPDPSAKPTTKTVTNSKPIFQMPVSAVQFKGGETPGQMVKAFSDAIAPLLLTLNTKDSESSLLMLEATVNHASRPGAESERVTCCQAICNLLQSDASSEAKVWLLNQLIIAGQSEVVAVETKLLDDKDPLLREAARCALQSNPSPEAATALRTALVKASDPASQAAFALALAARRDTASVPAIVKLLNDEHTVERALHALAIIGGSEATAAVTAALRNAPEKLRLAAATAALKCANQLLLAGQASQAAAAFHALNQPSLPPPVRHAALRGILTADGDQAVSKIMELLAADDADACSVALGQIKELSVNGRKPLVNGLGQLPSAMQATVLESLAGLEEKSVLPIALQFATSKDPIQRLAGLKTLGRVGDAANTPLICQALASSPTASERQPIEQVLCALPDARATSDAIIAAMKGSTGEVTRSFISVLAKRGNRSAVPALLGATTTGDVPVARAAFQALGNFATAEDMPVLLRKLADLPKPETRSDAENAAVRALAKLATIAERSEAVRTTLSNCPEVEARRSMLRLLVSCADAKAFDTVKAACTDKDPLIRETAIRAFSDWPSTAAWKVLPEIYRQPEKEQFRILALRGMVRLAATQNAHLNATWIERYRQLLAGARTDNDRRLILGALGGATDPAALDMMLPLLQNAPIRTEAELAIKKIATAIKSTHPDAARAALLKLTTAETSPPASPPSDAAAVATPVKKPQKVEAPVFITPETAGPDFLAQGEYEGTSDKGKLGAQVIALDSGAFHAVFLNGGLPGAGWDGSAKVEFDGRRQVDKIVFENVWKAEIANDTFSGTTDKGALFSLKKVIRHSPTEGAKPPAGAIVLFDGSSVDAWSAGKMDNHKWLLHGAKTKRFFKDFTLHLEFILPFKPGARGQSRGNSGVYVQDRYEIQVLDSFGLKGLDNDCGGLYHQAAPKVHMCYPPLQWQTYDIVFQAARFDAAGKKTKSALLTLKHNGVLIHENLEIKDRTPSGKTEESTPGPIHLQSKGTAHPVYYRNVWIVESN